MSDFETLLNAQGITDFYICLYDNQGKRVHDFPGFNVSKSLVYPGTRVFSGDLEVLLPYLNQVIEEFYKKKIEPGFENEFSISNGKTFFRCRLVQTVDNLYLSMRKLQSELPDIYALNLPRFTIDSLLCERFKSGGLILVVGKPGQGKSTTCVAALAERLKRYGGHCLTIEDPAEVYINGVIGEKGGACFQIEVTNEEEYRQAIKGALKSYPSKTDSLLYVGEIRDSFAAAHLLRASIDGRLVLTTMHAGNVLAGIDRLAALAGASMGVDYAYNILASGLRCVVHQSLVNDAPKIEQLLVNQQVYGAIQQKKIKLLVTELARQKIYANQKRTVLSIIDSQD